MKRKNSLLLLVFGILIFVTGCGKDRSPDEKSYIQKIENIREQTNNYMKNNPDSPFNYKGEVEFHDLKYYDVDPDYVFKSKLYEYNPKDTVKVFGTKGEERKTVRWGYVKINFPDKERKVNVYDGETPNGQKYYSIWFTDKTTNKETYGVGRYLEFEKKEDPDYIYTIDFNLAFNPYCAYSPNYSCAIPREEDHIDYAIEAGEKKFHD
jgi:uncharacterized protein (DUF1684 family)